ncbi:HvfC/BufC family peptide modification chaperone [Mangrovitalea sediminis]|uniref:HvfC/BufC family peptide modification chaperone n=1 Tax=Mangrovitalea sediminis TaxID=1982043 RepID=UPI000BE52B5B|nr:putative DNA-binding domain-containing protein [Mangrovitalea sediminis]
MNLGTLQQAFGDMLLGQPSAIADAIFDNRPCQSARLSVYRNHFLTSLQEALCATYPQCRRLLGDPLFYKLTRRYVTEHPPLESCVVNYGDGFPDFLGASEELEDHPAAEELAVLEWLVERSSLLPPAKPFPFSRLEAVDPEAYEHLVLLPAASLRFWTAGYAVDQLFDALVEAQPIPTLSPETLYLAVIHREQGIALSRLSPVAMDLLALCRDERPLADLPGGLQDTVLTELADLLGRGLIEDFSLGR